MSREDYDYDCWKDQQLMEEYESHPERFDKVGAKGHTTDIYLHTSPPVAVDRFDGKSWRTTPLIEGLADYLTCRVCGGACKAETVGHALRLHERQACSLDCLQQEHVERRNAYRAKYGREMKV